MHRPTWSSWYWTRFALFIMRGMERLDPEAEGYASEAGAALAKLFAAPIAHRGLHACGGSGLVENSLSAAAAAIAAGYGIECDVQLSRDGEVVVFHDDTLERLTSRFGLVAGEDAATLARTRLAGSDDTIPTLATFLAAIAGRVALVIEIKSDGDRTARLTERVLDALADYDGIAALESFDPAVVLQCRRAGCRRPVGLVGPAEDGTSSSQAALAASDFLSWNIAHLETAAAIGPPLSTWTVRSPADADRARRLGAQIVFEGMQPDVR